MLLASGWWSWFRRVARPAGFRERGDQWVAFRHERHRHWTIEVQVERCWDGSPSPEVIARGATRLTVKDDLGGECEVFVLPQHIFVQRGPGDVGVLMPNDCRSLGDLREDEIKRILSR